MNLLEMEPELATTVSDGPLETRERSDTEPTIVVDLFSDGYAIEKAPVPAATIVAQGVSAEAILHRLSEVSEDDTAKKMDGEEEFAPYKLTGDPAEIFGGIQVISGDAEGAQAYVRHLIGAVERPGTEALATTNMEKVSSLEVSPEIDEEAGYGKTILGAFRRSRLARLVAGGAVVASGALYWASSASGETLEQTCIDAGMKPSTVMAAKLYGARKQHGAGWSGRVRMQTDALPDECAQNNYYRLENARVLMQSGLHRSSWLNIDPYEGNNDGLGQAFNGSASGGLAFSNINHDHDPSFTKFNYICSPGALKTAVHFQQMLTMVHVNGTVSEFGDINGTYDVIAGSKTTTTSVKVYGAC